MTKYEMALKLTDRLIDPWTDCPEDYEDSEPIDLEYAKHLLEDLLRDDEDVDDPDYCVPEGTTPELLMEVYNCIIRDRQHQLHVSRLAEFIKDNECVCEYYNYFPNALEIIPVDFLYNDTFPFGMDNTEDPDHINMLRIGMKSVNTFSFSDEFCWFDKTLGILHSSNTPFADDVISAEEFAEYILDPDGKDCLDYFLDSIIDEDEIQSIFGCSENEVRSRYHLSC